MKLYTTKRHKNDTVIKHFLGISDSITYYNMNNDKCNLYTKNANTILVNYTTNIAKYENNNKITITANYYSQTTQKIINKLIRYCNDYNIKYTMTYNGIYPDK